MEFLMTYGWAILVVLAAIGALAYFGVLSPKNLLPSSCTVGAGFGCSDAKATATTVELTLRNNIGEDIDSVVIDFEGDIPAAGCDLNDPSLNAVNDPDGWSSYSWDTISCDSASCTISLAGTDPIRNGKDIAHFTFDTCSGLSGTMTFEFDITYQKTGENVAHTVEGKANLKVES